MRLLARCSEHQTDLPEVRQWLSQISSERQKEFLMVNQGLALRQKVCLMVMLMSCLRQKDFLTSQKEAMSFFLRLSLVESRTLMYLPQQSSYQLPKVIECQKTFHHFVYRQKEVCYQEVRQKVSLEQLFSQYYLQIVNQMFEVYFSLMHLDQCSESLLLCWQITNQKLLTSKGHYQIMKQLILVSQHSSLSSCCQTATQMPPIFV